MTTSSGVQRNARPLVPGEAAGTALVLRQALSLAGGMSLETGRIIDVHHPQLGALVADQVLVMAVGRGSSTSSTVLAEAIRLGIAPRAIVLREVDQILALGAIVARTLYGRVCPIVVADEAAFSSIATGDRVTISTDGSFVVEAAG